jgi:peptidyl-tRNA hydrolase
VLGRFFEEEIPLLKSTIDRSVHAVKCAIDNGLVSAMNTFNKIEEET